MSIPTADLFDTHGPTLASVSIQFRDFGAVSEFSGPVRTVRCFQDNALLKALLSTPGGGAVLVVDGGGSLETALLGDMVAGAAVEHGWAGVIIHGCVRDSVALGGLRLGVKALGTNPVKSGKAGTGEVDVPLRLGSVDILPGAMIYADLDGILVSRTVMAAHG